MNSRSEIQDKMTSVTGFQKLDKHEKDGEEGGLARNRDLQVLIVLVREEKSHHERKKTRHV